MQKEMANLLAATNTDDIATKAVNKEKAAVASGSSSGSSSDNEKMVSKLQQLKVLLFENELIELIRQESLHLGPLADSINENQAIYDSLQRHISELVKEISKQREIQEILQVLTHLLTYLLTHLLTLSGQATILPGESSGIANS